MCLLLSVNLGVARFIAYLKGLRLGKANQQLTWGPADGLQDLIFKACYVYVLFQTNKQTKQTHKHTNTDTQN